MALPNRQKSPRDGWSLAVELTTRWRVSDDRADHLLERIASGASPEARGAAQNLFFAVVRHLGRIEAALDPLLARAPRPPLEALLLVASAEILDNPATAPAVVVDHAVNWAKRELSTAESRLVNAVLRRAATVLREARVPGPDAKAEELAVHYSHPDWLVQRWLGQFGPEATRRLLEWDQTAAFVHVRWRAAAVPVPACLETTPWPGFHRLTPGRWAELVPAIEAGHCYLQDPATRLAAELASPKAGDDVLDLCAAPGGKSLQLADAMGRGRLVAVDRPGPRLKRLEENLARWKAGGGQVEIGAVAADVGNLDAAFLAARGLPESYAVVVLDAPCSNTGVLRHRVDAKWRLQPGSPAHMAGVQARLLEKAARLVRAGGAMVYSTCSIDAEENEQVVQAFLAGEAGRGFTLERQVLARPWEHGHDGAGVFRLVRSPAA